MLTRKFLILPLVLLFISCTITKRVHRPGYYVQWHKIQHAEVPEKTEPIAPITSEKVESFEEDIMPQLPSISSDSADQMETQNREIPVDSKVNAEKAKKSSI